MQKGKNSKLSDPTTGASAIGLKTGDKVPYTEMGYAVPKAKPQYKTPSKPSSAEPTTGASAIGLKTGDRVPRELMSGRKSMMNSKPASMSKMLGIKNKK